MAESAASFGEMLQLRRRLAREGRVILVDKPKGLTCREASAYATALWLGENDASSFSGLMSAATTLSSGNRPPRSGPLSNLKLGHCGTLDPMASGMLPVMLGQATKLQNLLPIFKKRYTAKLLLGKETDSGDADGNLVKTDESFKGFSDDAKLQSVLPQFTGDIEQTPSQYSAIRVQGQRAYDLARAGEKVEMPKRTVKVFDLKASIESDNVINLDVTCGTGTYIRSIGTDIAAALGTVGHLIELRRVSSGPFEAPLEGVALSKEDAAQDASKGVRIVGDLTLIQALECFAFKVDLAERDQFKDFLSAFLRTGNGKALYAGFDLARRRRSEDVSEDSMFVTDGEDKVVCLLAVNHTDKSCKSICVFMTPEDLLKEELDFEAASKRGGGGGGHHDRKRFKR